MFIILEPHGIVLLHFAYMCMSTFPSHWHANPPIFDRYGSAVSYCPACCGLFVKILITIEPYRIFGSKFAYLFILILSIHPGMQNDDEGLPSIILVGQYLLVKMLITLEPHGIF